MYDEDELLNYFSSNKKEEEEVEEMFDNPGRCRICNRPLNGRRKYCFKCRPTYKKQPINRSDIEYFEDYLYSFDDEDIEDE